MKNYTFPYTYAFTCMFTHTCSFDFIPKIVFSTSIVKKVWICNLIYK